MSDPMKSPDRDAADELLQNLTKRKTMEAPFARYCWQNSAQIIEALSELATLRRRVAEMETALKPFAAFAAEFSKFKGPFPQSGEFYTLNFTSITIEDFKAAAACLPSPLPPGRNEG